MNVLVNFYPIKVGGGQQVATNFINVIVSHHFNHNWYFFLGKNSELDFVAQKLKISRNKCLVLKYSYANRLLYNRVVKEFVKKNKIDIIYNYSPVLPIEKVPQVIRSVYSNLYFPEIPFWQDYSLLTRIKKKMIDIYRLKFTLKANGIIFENKSMLERAIELFNYPPNQVKYVEPSVSLFDESNIDPKYKFLINISEYKILYLSSWHLNKKITILPFVAKLLKENNLKIKFVLSLSKNDKIVRSKLIDNIISNDVSEYFEFIGKVYAIHVHQVVKSCDAMILLSKLECFSSNIIESYYFRKLLILADEPWARSICGDAALYINRDSKQDIFKKISNVINNPHLHKEIITFADAKLNSFNNPYTKVQEQVKFLEYIYEKFRVIR